MWGLLTISYKLLVNDRSKFAALLIGITFAVFLMVQMMSLFAGILIHASSTVSNAGAPMWVMDPAVQNASSAIPLPDYVLDEVRSVPGVKYAVPLYSGAGLVKLPNGDYEAATIMGLDDTSLFGRPIMLEGKIDDIYAENGFIIIKDAEYPKLGSPKIGTTFEINDHTAKIVGIAQVPNAGIFGTPTLYTTYNRALQYLPGSRFTMSYVLVQPKSVSDAPAIEAAIARLGYVAQTKTEFAGKIANFYTFKTGMGTNILLMTVISFVVGLTISAQTFYTFILENLEKFGALKAIGAKQYELIAMILFQATFASLTGYGLGVGLCTLVIWLAKLRIPDYAAVTTFSNLGLALVMVLIMAAVSGYLGVRKVLKIEPFDIFRG